MARRLIDVNKVIDSMQKCLDESTDKKYSVGYCAFESIIKCLKQEPTVDAVEVVRCRDCAKDGLFTCPICFIENKTLQFINHSPDFYCGEGERKDGADND